MKKLPKRYIPAIITVCSLVVILGTSLASFRFIRWNLQAVNEFTPIEIKLPIIDLASYEKLNKNGL